MTTTVSAASANINASEEAAMKAAGDYAATVTEAAAAVIDKSSIKEQLNIAEKQGGVSAAIQVFASIASELLNLLSDLISRLQGQESKAAKKNNSKKASQKASPAKTLKTESGNLASEKKSASQIPSSAASLTASPATSATAATGATATTQTANPSPLPIANTATQLPGKSTNINPAEKYSDDYLSLSTGRNGNPEIYTEDGYAVRFDGKDQAWNIITPEGRVNRIWGDPHVLESDGDSWDFREKSSFIFGNNKLTVDTVAVANGQTISSRISIYNGNSRISVSGIDSDKPVFEAISRDAVIDDALSDDGDIFILSREENGDDRFILLKDRGEKFDDKFAKQVS